MLATSSPYYRSTYVAVTRADRRLDIRSFDDPRLRSLKIGVQLVGDDGSNTPPAHALSRRGMIENVRGYMIYGDYGRPDPQSDIVRAVADGEVDVAFIWGPVAGYFAARQSVPLRLEPVTPAFDGPQLPMIFDVSVGIRKNDRQLGQRVDSILSNRSSEVRNILDGYRVPFRE
jgi:mxaJ protein